MRNAEVPLHQLFERLCAAGLPLGPGEYLALLRLCRMLWTTSREEGQILEHHFRQILSQIELAPERLPAPTRPAPATEEPPPPAAPRQEPAPRAAAEQATVVQKEQTAVPAVVATQRVDDLPFPGRKSAGEYYPVTRRQLNQSWRHLRRIVRQGPLEELDLEATVAQIERQGVLTAPVLRPLRRNQAELLLLQDRDGSMVPFHGLGKRLIETAAQGGRLGRLDVRYFHNTPLLHLYREPGLCEGEAVDLFLSRVRDERTGVLIFSDAGAARGHYRPERIDETRDFIAQCRQRVRWVAWLNPMPKERWRGTSARTIAGFVPMFAMDRFGLDQAIAVLRGRSVPGYRP